MPLKTESKPFSSFPSVSLLPKTETNVSNGTPLQMPVKTETNVSGNTPCQMPLKTETNTLSGLFPTTSFNVNASSIPNFQMPPNISSNPPSGAFTTPFTSTLPPSTTQGLAKRKIDKFAPSPFIDPSAVKRFNSPPSPYSTGPSMFEMPKIENNTELKKIIEINTNNIPFLGTVPNPFETANPVQHSTDPNLNFVDNTFKYSDIFDKKKSKFIFEHKKYVR